MKHRNILIITDDHKLALDGDLFPKADGSARYHLLTFGYSAQSVIRNSPDLADIISPLDTKEISLRAEKESRDYYLELIRDLVTRLPGILSYHGRNLWWFLNMTEKSIWTDRTIHRIYAVLRFYYALSGQVYDEIYLQISDQTLKMVILEYCRKKSIPCKGTACHGKGGSNRSLITTALIYYYQLLREVCKIAFQLVGLRLLGVRPPKELTAGSISFFSIYPIWWGRPFSKRPFEIFFQDLPDRLSQNKKVSYLLWLLGGGWRIFKAKDFLKRREVLILGQLLKAGDFISLFDPGLFLRLFNFYKLSAELSLQIKDADISPFIREEIFKSITNPLLFHWLLLDKSMRRLPAEKLKGIIFRFEPQPLEKALLYNTRKKVITIGFQHSSLGRNFLNYVYCPGELKAHWLEGHDENMPLPDYIITSGSSGAKYLKYAGYPAERTAVGAGIRISGINDYLKSGLSAGEAREKHGYDSRKKIIFIPASQLIAENLSLLSDLLYALSRLEGDYHIIVKCNPNIPDRQGFSARIREMFAQNRPGLSFEIAGDRIPLYDYIRLSDAVLLTGGTAAQEAMLLGVVPIIYVCYPQFSHNPMLDYPEAAFFAEDVATLTAALKNLSDADKLSQVKNNWPKVIDDLFASVTDRPYEKMMKRIEEILC